MNAPVAGKAVRSAQVVLIGPPNAGKSTLFNRITGASAGTGNYHGTTVSVERARRQLGPFDAQLVDVPGAASLTAQAADEEVTLRALLDLSASDEPSAVLLVLDAARLSRSLYLAVQVLALELPTVVALNLIDEARASGREPDAAALAELLGVPVVSVSARTGEGIEALVAALEGAFVHPEGATPCLRLPLPDALEADVVALREAMPPWACSPDHPTRERALTLWALLSDDGARAARRPLPEARIAELRSAAEAAGRDIEAEIVGTRYGWIDARMPTVAGLAVDTRDRPRERSDAIDRVLLHPVAGSLVFLAVMWTVFLALFSWSDPLIGAIEAVFGAVGAGVSGLFEGPIAAAGAGAEPLGIVRDLMVDGVVAGVGAVLVFLPQIAILFLLLAVLEDCGYLARAAALMDRVLRAAGLPGKAFVPLLSGFACAVPAILATRSVPRWRDRLLTMLVIPLTTCSARLPVYTLMVGALFPAWIAGWPLPVQPTALLGMYLFSTVITLIAAVVLGRTVLKDEPEATILELPPYRMPSLRNVARTVWVRSTDFVREAGGIILVATVVLWALLAFPRHDASELFTPDELAEAVAAEVDVDALLASRQLEASYAGQVGRAIEPVIEPLGFDWKIGVGLIGAFAAREVFVSTMGIVYGIAEADEATASLREQIRTDVRPDGRPLWSPLTGASLMVFFALAMQCLSTLAVLKKETGGWRWPLFVTAYMSALAWVMAFAVYQGGRLLGWG